MNTEFPMGRSEEIFEDTDGFLWIGTVNGLVRFDGYETYLFTQDPGDPHSIAANSIDAIGQDAKGRIWVGLSDYGLDILDAELKMFKHLCLPDTDGVCMQRVTVHDLAPSGDSIMWVASTNGLLKFSLGENPKLLQSFRHDPKDFNSLTGNFTVRTFLDSQGRLWVGTLQGINLFQKNSSTFINHHSNHTFPRVQILDITEDRKGKIWISTRFLDECLLVYNEETENFESVPEYRDRKMGEFRITFDHRNDLWISSRGVGAFHVDAQTGVRTFFDPNNVATSAYRNVYGLQPFTDRYGNVWITGEQLMKWPSTGKGIKRISTNENQVIAIYANHDAIWYSDNKPKRFDRKTLQTTAIMPDLFPTNIRKSARRENPIQRTYCIREFDADHIILTTARNVFISNANTNAMTEYPLDFGGPFREFVITPDKNHLWICGNQGSPILFELQTGKASRPKQVASILNPLCVAQAPNGDLWFGSSTYGVYLFEVSTNSIQNFHPGQADSTQRLSDYHIHDITLTGSKVWIATNQGLNVMELAGRTITNLPKHIPLHKESCLSVLADDDGMIWLGTQSGLVYYNPASEEFRRYGRDYGLINTVYTPGACFKDKKGILYFGGDQGIDYFDPRRMGINPVPPDLYISRILVNNKPIDTIIAAHHLSNLDLTYKEKFIEIELLALHLTASPSNRYAYQIPELDTVWRDLGRHRTITLANLQPGSYTLRARAANGDSIWSEDKTLLQMKIHPPFWATWWFILGSILATGVLITSAYRYHIRQIKTREGLKSAFNKQVAELESKALRAQMNPHFLFNGINSVKSLISQGQNEKATQYLTRFGQLIRQVLANSEKPFVRLQEELEALRLYLEIEQLRFQNFTYRIEVEEGVNADFIEVPPLILQPYVENAIWHGLMHKASGERTMVIQVSRKGDFLHMSVEDNGIGREKARQMKMLGDVRKGGMGMRLTADRLNLMRKIYGKEVDVNIIDLSHQSQVTGTRVEIRIPCLE